MYEVNSQSIDPDDSCPLNYITTISGVRESSLSRVGDLLVNPR